MKSQDDADADAATANNANGEPTTVAAAAATPPPPTIPTTIVASAASRDMSNIAYDIEKQSFEIIDSEIGYHQYSPLEWPIVQRVIHATADFDFARKERIIFHKAAIDSAFKAIDRKCSIVTDVDMVLAAINKKSIADLGLKASCYISDKNLAEKAKQLNKTRSEVAMRHASKEIDKGIVVIGNAPTALKEVIFMIKEGEINPALVVGIPVGFISAMESKQELAKLQVPFITNLGRKGGSPAAASILNAILLLYKTTKI
jgi:precorrin-8X/cobalt-precorrin-8 methylmutase